MTTNDVIISTKGKQEKKTGWMEFRNKRATIGPHLSSRRIETEQLSGADASHPAGPRVRWQGLGMRRTGGLPFLQMK